MLFEIWLTELAKQGGEYIFDSESFVCLLFPIGIQCLSFENDSLSNLMETILFSAV